MATNRTISESDLSQQIKGTKGFEILEEKVAYKRYITVWDRLVQYPDGRKLAWDVCGHSTANPAFAVCFPFDTKTQTTTLIREYAQGANELKYTFAAGGFDVAKHSSILECARQELSEESRLTGGDWISLLPNDHPGIGELKWSRNRFIPFLVLNPVRDQHPKQRDAEEWIEVHRGVSISELKNLIMRGEVMLPSVQTAWMAIEYLKDNKLLLLE
ncbi:hypothetical protein BC832DRAFT_588645 [Gaertneriomyces semiglobifer]|nr:hypothetical protein BC832DRAFT_588645 [Gaertneriomyces semiglobifer]